MSETMSSNREPHPPPRRCIPSSIQYPALDSTIDPTIDSTIDATIDSIIDSTIDSIIDSTIDSTLDATIDSIIDASLDASLDSALCTLHSVIRTPHSVLLALPKKVPHLCRFRLELHCILDLGGRYVATARTRPVGSHLPYIMFVGKGGCRGCRTLQGTVNLAGLVVKSKRVGGTGVILGRLEARKVACDTPASCSSA